MRTLVLQLARFGDIYQTWPTLNALRREGGEVHVLVRERFRGGLDGLDGVTVHTLRTADVLAPILEDGDCDEALARLTVTLDHLSGLGFTRIINLSFSPFSSHVTAYLSGPDVAVRGYTRHEDGYFTVADDFSAYFYAQVGVGRANRYHLTDLFAGVAGVELTDQDLYAATPPRARAGVVVHLGASQAEKAYPPELWAEVVRALDGEPLTVIGSADERPLAEAVLAGRADAVNLAGRTGVADLFTVLAGAKLLVGADSAPIHVAALTGTPVLNLSCDAVNFWETGPTSAGSRILREAEISRITPARIAAEARALLDGRAPVGPVITRPSRTGAFVAAGPAADDFTWALTEALYTGSTYPPTTEASDRMAFLRIFEVSELALTQLARWDGAGQAEAARHLALIDEILKEVPRVNPRVAPLTQWFETERVRLGPAAPDDTLRKTYQLFADLKLISSVYVDEQTTADAVQRVVDLGRQIAPSLREYDFARVENDFHALVAGLHDLARRSTKVEGWSTCVNGLSTCLAERDLIELADRLEFDLPRDLKTWSSGVLV